MATKKPIKVTAIIVNYNTKQFLKRCIKNLYKNYSNIHVVVVDNSSSDGSYDMVKKEFSKVTLVSSPNNGLAHGFNRGIEKVKNTDYFLFLGSDAYPKEGCIGCMVQQMESDTKVGIGTAKLIMKDGRVDIDAHRGFPDPWTALTHFSRLNKLFPKSKIFNRYFREYEDFSVPHEIDMCISHFMLIKSSVLKKLKGFDEDYWLYGEDVDICYRVKQLGYKVMYYANCESWHYKGVSVGVRKNSKNISTANKATRERSRKASVKSMKTFYSKHYSKKYPKVVTMSVLSGINIISFLRNVVANAFDK